MKVDILVAIPHGGLGTRIESLLKKDKTLMSPSHTVGLERRRFGCKKELVAQGVYIPHGGLRTTT